MKYNSLCELKNGKEVEVKGEVIIVLTSKELALVTDAIDEYAKAHPRSKAVKSLKDSFYNVPLA
jgi:hypothetical protein